MFYRSIRSHDNLQVNHAADFPHFLYNWIAKIKNVCINILLSIFFLYFQTALATSFEDDNTPVEQGDIKTINQLDQGSNIEEENTPIEKGDMKTIHQLDQDTGYENENTPIERNDMKTINQINDY